MGGFQERGNGASERRELLQQFGLVLPYRYLGRVPPEIRAEALITAINTYGYYVASQTRTDNQTLRQIRTADTTRVRAGLL